MEIFSYEAATKEGDNGSSHLHWIIGDKVREKDIMTFTCQLGVLLEAGFTIDKGLLILLELTEKRAMREVIKELLSSIRGGKSLSAALSKFPLIFPDLYINMIKAGETGGFLEDAILRLANHLEDSQRLREDMHSALIYPILLGIIGGVAIAVLLIFVVPRFTMIFSDMGQALPLPTLILLSISSGIKYYWWLILSILLGCFLLLRYYLRSAAGRRYWDTLRFRLPLFGRLYRQAAVSRFARTLGTLLQSGVPILHALQAVEGTLGSDRMAQMISSVRESVRKGKRISGPLKDSDIFPPIAIHMVTIGEEAGKLDEMLLKIAEQFDSEVRITVKRLLSLLEPGMILFMGLIVGFIVIAILMAIFSLNELPF
ncbi:MAG: type II secretion system F family protein [Nitrospirota bacterium]